jgi:hypothetical protein
VSEVSPGHLKFKFHRLLKKFLYWQRAVQLYGPPYTGCPTGVVQGLQIDLAEFIGHVEPKNRGNKYESSII